MRVFFFGRAGLMIDACSRPRFLASYVATMVAYHIILLLYAIRNRHTISMKEEAGKRKEPNASNNQGAGAAGA